MFRELDYELQSAVLGPNAVSSIRTGRGFYVCTAKSRPWNSIRDILPPSREAYRLHLGPPEKRLRFIGLQASLLIRHALPTNSGVGDFSETLRVPLVPSKELRPLLKRVFFTPPPREFGLGAGAPRLRGHEWNVHASVDLAHKSNLPIVAMHPEKSGRRDCC